MTRVVREINAVRDSHDAVPRPFSEFADRTNVVLLGDPGAGKTHLFREAATAEQARFIKARAFLNTPPALLHGQGFFIDGLDERRAGRGDQDTVDALVVKLFEVAPSKVRISCRVADWLGDSDLAAMAPFFDQQGGACVLHLESLSRREQIGVLFGQGVSSHDAERFLDQAVERGLDGFLDNPQNLIMLWRAVQSGAWPATRNELFELSTTLMLQEANPERARSGGGVFSVAELRPVAGAICAARLISDVDAITLTDQEGTPDIPGYRLLDLFEPARVQAALSRRVFDAAAEPEAVDYAHRTTAEFLAAEFLASRVRKGLPFGRVMALMGVDGHPASELRGLHAWLAVHLPEHADELIEADPYGVLTYGDAAALSASSCTVLVRALERLSQKNPWFRSGHWQARPIGALARPDMVGEFRAILDNPASGFGVRSIVVDALALGAPLPELLPVLQVVLARQASPFAERIHALEALLRLGDAGKTSIRTVFDTLLGNSVNDLRLRVAIIQVLYDDPYGPEQVIALVQASFTSDDIVATGMLWSLPAALPDRDLPAILDGIDPPTTNEAGVDRKSWEGGSFYARILARVWSSPDPFEPGRAMRWLCKRAAFKGSQGESRTLDLRTAMRANPERLRALAEDFFTRFPVDKDSWLAFHRFRKAILFELNPDELAAIVIRIFEACKAESERRLFLYEVAFSLSYQIEHPRGATLFADLYQRAENDPALRAARDTFTLAYLPENYLIGRLGIGAEDQSNREREQAEFDENIEQIRKGAHLGWLRHLGLIYFGLYGDADRSLTPRARIAAWLGEERVAAALEALAATLSRDDLPGFADVMALTAHHQHYDWWYALIAGLNERWGVGQHFSGLSDDLLKGLLVFDITNPVSTQENNSAHWVIHPWRTALMEERPELALDAYLAVARLRLSCNEELVDGLRELLNEAAFEPYRPAIIIDLLRCFPNAHPFRLGEILDAVVALPTADQEDFVQLAGSVISGVVVDERQCDLWLVTVYLIRPVRFENHVRQRAAMRPDLVFDLRDRSRFARRGQPDQALPLPMVEFMARLTGSLFPDAPLPLGSSWGDANPWDASEYFRALINMISASPSPAATDALRRLEADPRLISYQPHLLYALDNQQQRRRETEYDRPDWLRTIAALADRGPATVADFHALLVAQLRDLAHRITRANTDIFKQFWNLDAYSRPTEPRPEEACRDHVVTLLRPALFPKGVVVEPEGHMAADKRADISAAMPGRKILCELKRDYHPEVWTAIRGQLERFYAHDPEAKGFGIYVVLWFGKKRPRGIPTPPSGMQLPKSAGEMEATLRSILPSDMGKRLTVIVVDVSG
jgi:predicted NACHT family NTPase